jgi:lipopolysaccharide/colanic/teichoic acid biosynthesis glycosyltransferase
MSYSFWKRVLDVVSASVGLVVLAPVFGAIAIWIRIKAPGPVFYRGKRVGRDGRIFSIVKFRSMVEGAELMGGTATADDDPRLTVIGHTLRRYKLDELPQLWNVLVGDMSLVGPRPEVEKYVQMYNDAERRLLTLRPGITDWATIWDSNEGEVLAGSSDPERAYEEIIRPTKIRLQLDYLNQHSFVTDLKIIFHTMMRLVKRSWTPREIAGYESPLARRARGQAAAVVGRT